MKWMETELIAMKKIYPWLKTQFPSISQANMYFFSIGKFFFVWTKNILSRQTDGALVIIHSQAIFCEENLKGCQVMYKYLEVLALVQ